MDNFMVLYEAIVNQMKDICIAKNKDYGTSVQDTYEKFGDLAYIVRLHDKWNRINSLMERDEAEVKDESIDDTILDMANYLLLWLTSRKF